MEAKVKKLDNYPATVFSGVFKDGTNISLDEFIGNEQPYDVLKGYKGKFDFAKRQTLRGGEVGDYWIYDGEERLNLDGNVIYPNSYIYIDMVKAGENECKAFKHIKILKDITFKPKSHYDVVIVGGGAGGIGTAYALKDSGLKVALIERFDTLGGTHCNGVGLMIANPVGDWYKDICKQAFDDGSLDF